MRSVHTASPSYNQPAKRTAETEGSGLSQSVTRLCAVACGLSVANIYAAQPLLETMARDLAISPATIGVVITVTQVGYGLGLLLLVPLGDMVNRRRLITLQALLSALALLLVGLAPTAWVLLAGMTVVGLLAVVVQVLVAYAAALAAPGAEGRVVGVVTSGVVLGILLARAVSGVVAEFGGWRSVYLASAAATLLMAGLLHCALPRHDDRPTVPSYGALLRSVVTLLRDEPLLRARAGLAALIFAVFSVLWTSIALPLSAPPHALSTAGIGLFGLAGAAGALGAARAGLLADRGLGQRVTGLALLLLLAAWLPIAFTNQSLWALVVGIVALDMAVQAVHVTSQSLLFATRPDARSRLVGAYMVFYSLGSAVGSLTATVVYAHTGWLGVCVLGASISVLALLFWSCTLCPSRSHT